MHCDHYLCLKGTQGSNLSSLTPTHTHAKAINQENIVAVRNKIEKYQTYETIGPCDGLAFIYSI